MGTDGIQLRGIGADTCQGRNYYRRLRFSRDICRWSCLDSGLQSAPETAGFSTDVNDMSVV